MTNYSAVQKNLCKNGDKNKILNNNANYKCP